jgi:hypothetical protein
MNLVTIIAIVIAFFHIEGIKAAALMRSYS